ncbi:MAG: TonB-dependent receptor plug domain-containing protein, partial [Halieaceae bacterium]|nr:TonB-dependent receptor plug domain-containing protein [Halieaceae bacterium]
MTFMPANAQDDLGANQLEEVIVTGSRIQRLNLVSASPVTQVDAEEFKFSGTTRVEDLVKNLPQVYSQQNSTQQNGATGTATLNLRNLGDERTLTLINGRRMPAGSPVQGGQGADINQIPGALIKRVEVLTGGASATYGSDAVAGVVNFIMVDDFEGVQFDAQYSGYTHDNDSNKWQGVVEGAGYPAPSGDTTDGEIEDISLIIGGNFEGGRGNATAYGT